MSRVKPDLVLLDVEMPGVDGAETARRLRLQQPDLVILAWTVSDEGDDLLRMLQAGARVDFVVQVTGYTAEEVRSFQVQGGGKLSSGPQQAY